MDKYYDGTQTITINTQKYLKFQKKRNIIKTLNIISGNTIYNPNISDLIDKFRQKISKI